MLKPYQWDQVERKLKDMPREKAQIVDVETVGSQFRFQDFENTLIGVQLLDKGEMVTKFSKNGPDPYTMIRVVKIIEDGSVEILTSGFKMFASLLVRVFGSSTFNNWLTGRWVKSDGRWIWEDNKPEEEELCDSAIESLEKTEEAMRKLKAEF